MKDIAIGQQEAQKNPELFPPSNEEYLPMLLAIIAASARAARDSNPRDGNR